MILVVGLMSSSECPHCPKLHETIAQLRAQLRETIKLAALQKADLDRLAHSTHAPQVNRAERVAEPAMQLALDRILVEESTAPPQAEARDDASEHAQGVVDLAAIIERKKKEAADTAAQKAAAEVSGQKKPREPAPHGRRKLDMSNLPVETVYIDADEVLEHPERYEIIGEDIGTRVGYQPGSYKILRLVRPKAVLRPEFAHERGDAPKVVVAPLPPSLWPHFMADPSAVGRAIVAKYGDCLPLHRQEAISAREGFVIPRSTLCGWLDAAYAILHRIADAMLADARARAFCIATDATSAPMRAPGENVRWHMFVLLADRDHVIFRPSADHTSEAVQTLLKGYKGRVLADAATVFDQLYTTGEIIEVGCWFHLRRYFWRGIATEPERAYEALALIGQLFEIERDVRHRPLDEKTTERARRARPILALLDAWVARHREGVDARGPVAQAIGYYLNQRTALHRFLEDGRLRLDNNLSEQALRHLVVGRANWTFFANETGIEWYACFRTLIASCALHGLNAQTYLEEVLRLAPHWPVTRMLELSPMCWARTRAQLTAEHKKILVPPWELSSRARDTVTNEAA